MLKNSAPELDVRFLLIEIMIFRQRKIKGLDSVAGQNGASGVSKREGSKTTACRSTERADVVPLLGSGMIEFATGETVRTIGADTDIAVISAQTPLKWNAVLQIENAAELPSTKDVRHGTRGEMAFARANRQLINVAGGQFPANVEGGET